MVCNSAKATALILLWSLSWARQVPLWAWAASQQLNFVHICAGAQFYAWYETQLESLPMHAEDDGFCVLRQVLQTKTKHSRLTKQIRTFTVPGA